MFDVFFTEYFTDWLDSLTLAEKESVLHVMGVLTQYGYNLKRPHADTIKGSKLTNLKELRIQHDGNPYRAFFVFDPTRKAVLLCGGDKTGDKRFYDKMIPIAERVYSEYLATLENNDRE